MRYSKSKSDHFLESRGTVLRVAPVIVMPDPTDRGRTVRVFQILQCIKPHPNNPSPPRGSMLAISFPSEHVNATEYKWGPNESFQVPYEIADRKANLAALTKN